MASTKAFQAFGTSSNLVSRSIILLIYITVYKFQNQNSQQTLKEALEEFYSINVQFKNLVEKNSPNAKVFKEHDYTHVLFGLGTSIEEESLLDTYVIWGMKFNWGVIFDFYKDPEYKEVIGDIVSKYGGYWGIFKIYLSLMPLKFRVFLRCMKMKKKWHYHDISERLLNRTLQDIRQEYNIVLMPLKDIPINRYASKAH